MTKEKPIVTACAARKHRNIKFIWELKMILVQTENDLRGNPRNYAIVDKIEGKRYKVICRLPDGIESEKLKTATFISYCLERRIVPKDLIVEQLQLCDDLLNNSRCDDNDRVISAREIIERVIKILG